MPLDRSKAGQERAPFALRPGHDTRFRLIADTVPGMVFTAAPDGERDYHNQWWCDFTGFSPEAATGRGWARALHPEDRERALAAWAQAVGAGEPWESRHRLRAGDASYWWVLARATPALGPAGEILGWTGVVIEIDELVRTQESLLASERRFRLAFEAAPNGRLLVAENGVIVLANAQIEKLFGYRVDELTGQPVEILVPERFRGRHPGLREGFRSEPAMRPMGHGRDLYGLRKDGSEFPVEIGLNPLKEEGGFFVLASIADITRRKQAEDARLASEADRRATAEAVPGILFAATADGQVDHLNQRFHEMTGLPVESGTGSGWIQVVHPADRARLNRRWTVVLRDGGRYESRLRIRTDDGSYRWMMVRALPVFDTDGQVGKWVGVAFDIEEAVRAEEALKEADRRKNEFLAILSHELRNPLAPLCNGLELLELAGDDAVARERVVAMMKRQVGQMIRLIDDLLDVSRVSTGRIELRKERVELADVVNSAVEATRPEIETSGRTLDVSIPAERVRLHADPVRLVQVLQNLLKNAIRFTGERGRVVLSATREGDEVVFRVRDTGIGIEPEDLPRIFEMFEQARRTDAPREAGLGIGLSLVRALVELHGGTVNAFSEGAGQGSEFVVRLPVRAPDLEKVESPGSIGIDMRGDSSLAEPLRILVVDDNRDAAESLATLLGAVGHHVRTACEGAGGLKEAVTFRPAVALLDLGMPGMSGYEMARRLRETPGLRGIVLVAVTGWGEQPARRASREAGFDHHLVKPVNLVELRRLIEA